MFLLCLISTIACLRLFGWRPASFWRTPHLPRVHQLPCSGQKLALAAKLQARLAQHMPCLAPEQHPQLHLLHHILCLETAARQGDGAALLQCISKLQAHAGQLTAAQRASILSTVCSQHSMVVQEAAARLLLDSMAADGGLPAMSLLPAMLGQLSLSAEMRLRAVCRCRQLLAAMPLESRDSSWIQCTEVSE